MGCCCPMLLFIILVFETVCVLCKYPCKCYKKVNFKEIPCMRDVGLLQHWKVTLDIENIVYEVLKYMLSTSEADNFCWYVIVEFITFLYH